MIVCQVSGDPTQTEAFQMEQPEFSCLHREIRQSKITKHISRWFLVCSGRQVDQISDSVNDVVEFLTEQYHNGLPRPGGSVLSVSDS